MRTKGAESLRGDKSADSNLSSNCQHRQWRPVQASFALLPCRRLAGKLTFPHTDRLALSEIAHVAGVRRHKTPWIPLNPNYTAGTAVAAVLGMDGPRLLRVLGAAAVAMVLTPSLVVAQTDPKSLRMDLRRTDRYVGGLQVRSPVLPPLWVDQNAVKLPRYPFMADPRRWPRLFANTTECTLSLNPVTRRHWRQ